MELSVVIPCHGEVALTRACLRSLRAQQGAPQHEVLLAGHTAAADAAAAAADHAGLRAVPLGANRGFAGNVAAGVAAAHGRLLLILNNDTELAPHCLAALCAVWRDAAADAAVAGGPDPVGLVGAVADYVKPAQRIALRAADDPRSAAGRAALEAHLAASAPPALDVDVLSGLCLLTDRRTWELLGGFDTAFAPGYWEDDDLSLRADLHGRRLLIARHAFVHHRGARTFAALGLDQDAVEHAGATRFLRKWAGDPAGAAWLLARAQGARAAAAELPAARRSWPAWPGADLLAAHAALEDGRADDATLALLQRFLGRRPLHRDARRLVAVAHALRGDRPRAARAQAWLRRFTAADAAPV